MKSATLVTMLTSLTTAMAVAAPFVVFGFLYVLLVQPERAGAGIARNELNLALADLDRQRSSMRAPSASIEAVAAGEFVSHAARVERPSDLVDALTDLLNGPAVGGVSNLLVGTGASAFEPYARDIGVRRAARADRPILPHPACASGAYRSPDRGD